MKIHLLLRIQMITVILAMCYSSLQAQWQFNGSPENCHPLSFDAEGDTILVMTSSGLYFSVDDAVSWNPIHTPDGVLMYEAIQIENGTLYLTALNPVFFENNSIWKNEIYRSDDWGSTWHLITGSIIPTNGLSNLIIQGDTVYYLSFGSFFISFDKGESFSIELPNAGFNRSHFIHDHLIHSLSRHTVGNSLLRSSDYGDTWETIYTCSGETNISTVNSIDDVLWKTETRLNEDDVYISYSLDDGESWITTDTLQVPFSSIGQFIGKSGNLFLVSSSQSATLYFSEDDGHSWIERNLLFPGSNPFYNNDVLLTATSQGIFKSQDDGASFSKSFLGLQSATVVGIAHSGPTLWCNANFTMYSNTTGNQQWNEHVDLKDVESTIDGHLIGALNGIPHRSEDGGQTWIVIPPDAFGQPFYYTLTAIEAAGNVMYCFFAGDSYYSTDNGVTWEVLLGLWISGGYVDISYSPEKFTSTDIFGRVLISDNGFEWNTITTGFPDNFWEADMVHYHDPYFFVADDTFLIRLHKDSSDFEIVSTPAAGNVFPVYPLTSSYSMESHGNVLIAALYGNGVFASQDNGDHWYAINNGLDNFQTTTLSIINTDLYLGVDGGVWHRPLFELAPYQYSGVAYKDINANGIWDNGENGLANVPIRKVHQESITYSGADGNFLLLSDSMDPDSIEALAPTPHTVITTSPVYVTGSVDSLHFGVYITPGIYDATVTLTNETPLRPGFEATFFVQYKNNGTETADMEIKLSLDNQLEYISSSILPDFSGDTLIWMIQGVEPLASGNIIVKVKVNESSPIGSIVNLLAHISINANSDFNPADNIDELSLVVVGAYDPNDKSVFPSGYITPMMIADTQRLEYTIRFQNTGNFPATFVRIQDTLSSHLDLSSLEILSASHSFTWQLLPKNVLDVYFDNINLPDSTADERSSHGFVKFAINAKTNLQLADQIENKAYIYFDFNQPVVTNTVGSTVGFGTATKDPAKRLSLSASPVPTKDFVTISIDITDVSGDVKLSLYDSKGVFVKSQTSFDIDDIQIDMRDLPSGIYLLQTKIGDRRGNISIVKN